MVLARKKVLNERKIAIVQVAMKMFLERGFSDTSVRAIAAELGISSGNVTFYFSSKDHLLSILVELLCDFQWEMMRRTVGEGQTSLMAVCLELVAMAAICDENESVKDFYLAAYTNPMSLAKIRKSDIRRAKQVFGQYCTDWTDEQFNEAETLVSGIEFATLMTTEESATLPVRIAGALNQIMAIYRVPPEIRKRKTEKVLAMDYSAIGHRILGEFVDYVDHVDDTTLDMLLER